MERHLYRNRDSGRRQAARNGEQGTLTPSPKSWDSRLPTSDVVRWNLGTGESHRPPVLPKSRYCNREHANASRHRSSSPAGPWTLRVCPAARRRWLHARRERVVSRGTRFPAPSLKPEVAERIGRWQMRLGTLDPQARKRIDPVVRELVAAAGPKTEDIARRQLRLLGVFMVWADRSAGSLAPEVINPHNVSAFIEESAAEGRSVGWQAGAKTTLQSVGRAVNPAAWSAKLTMVPRPPASLPYDAEEESRIRLASHLPGPRNLAGVLWSVAGPLGAGMRSPEATAAEVSDIREWGDGRLAVQIHGPNSRLVPIREFWTDSVREAIALVEARPRGASRKFIVGDSSAGAARIARNLQWGGEGGVSLHRTRTTWLAAHLRARTPLPELRILMGGSPGDLKLQQLLLVLDLSITPEEAVVAGLRA